MRKYHINQNTGQVAECRAQEGNCPVTKFTGEKHFDTREEAQERYEQIQQTSGGYLTSTKNRNDLIDESDMPLIEKMAEFISSDKLYSEELNVEGVSFYIFYEDLGTSTIDLEGVATGVVDDVRIRIDRDKYDMSGSAIIFINGKEEYIKGSYTKNVSHIGIVDEDFGYQKLMLRSVRAARRNYPELFNPDEEVMAHYRELEKAEEEGNADFGFDSDFILPGYVENFEKTTSYFFPHEDYYEGTLPNGRTLTIYYEDERVQASIDNERILYEESMFSTKKQKRAFLAKTMKALDERPELSVEYHSRDNYIY